MCIRDRISSLYSASVSNSDTSEFDTLEEYKADVKKHLEVEDVYKRQVPGGGGKL